MNLYRKILYSITTVMLLYFITPFYNIDYRLEPYYDTYRFIAETTCQKKLFSLPWRFSLVFDKLDTKVNVGITNTFRGTLYTTVKISIDEEYFNKLSEDDKTSLVFHELTHYFYNKEHINGQKHFMDCCTVYTGSIHRTYKQLKEIVEEECLK